METNLQKTMPALALRGLTVFPNMLLHFDVGRAASIKALDESMGSGQPIFLVAQRDLAVEDPQEKDLYSVGTVCNVRQLLRLPGDNVRVMVEGLSRGRLLEMTQTEPYLAARVEELPAEQPVRRSARTEALIRQTYELFESFIELAPKMTPDILLSVLSSEDPGYIADYIAQNLPMRTGDKQAILEELRPVRRLERLCQSLRREVEILEMEQELQGKVREQLTRSQRDYVLREQMKVIQQELGEDGAGGDSELAEYRQRIAGAKLPREVAEKLNKEVGRLEKQPFGSAEASVIRGYLDTVLELPWGKKTKERVDVAAARKVLDADHFGLDKVKERILEFLAVKQLAPQLRGQILCLVGPPGVGKTSIAMSMARAWAASTTRRRSAATARPTWGPCPAASSLRCGRRAPATHCCCWTRSTSWAATSGEIPHPPCWRCWTPSRTALSGITTWRCPSTCPTCSSSPPPIPWTPSPGPCWTGWRSLS